LGSNIADFFVNIDRMQAHFENIQRIADTATLPHAINYLSSRIAEDLDLSQLLERLQKAKGQPNSLTPLEKIELWDRLKIISMNLYMLCVYPL
jgi:peroxin-3